jgi:hypothetical protein
VAFEADRYARTHGIVIDGEGGQFADRTFDFPTQYPPASEPNMYAPGPIGSRPGTRGGFHTSVTFRARGAAAQVAGFGAVFIDPDHPSIGPCALEVFDHAGNLIAEEKGFAAGDASQVFRGLVVVDSDNRPVSVVSEVRITNGNEWPAYNAGEGVPLDDFVFSVPVRRRP